MARLDEILTKVIGQIWTSRRMGLDLVELCSFGSRFSGSPGEALARSFVIRKLEAAGLQNVRTWEFDYHGWARGTCSLRIPEHPSLTFSPISLVGSPSTTDIGLTAELIDLGNGSPADFERAADRVAGKVVMVSSGSAGGRAYHRREKFGWAVERGAAGFIYANHLPGMLPLTGSLRPDRLAEIPAISVSREEGAALTRLVASETVHVRLDVQNSAGPARAAHVFADIPGQTDEVVMLSSHYDGHDISPSALDNGTGLVTTLELARLLAPYGGEFRRTIRVACWTVEEWGLVGSSKFVASQTDEELRRIGLVINLDTTSALGPLKWVLNGFTGLDPFFQQVRDESGLEFAVGQEVLTNSDHFSFLLRGVPAVWLQGTAPTETTTRRYVLTSADTLDKVSIREMKESGMVAAQLLVRAADFAAGLPPHLSQAEVRDLLRRAGLEAALKSQEKWPA